MAKLNLKARSAAKTFEGGRATPSSAETELRRTVMSCLLWENSFYEDGVDATLRMKSLIPKVKAEEVADIAYTAKTDMKLRHVPLFLAREMARYKTHKHLVAELLPHLIMRADELSEFLAIYWKDGRTPISAQVKKGLAKAFNKFSEYELAKYNRESAVKLRDVLFMVHAKPESLEQARLWKKLIDGKLETPDTWEVALSAGDDKKETWERLIKEKKLGGLAMLRNLRNMTNVQLSEKVIRQGIEQMKTDRILPFRFISAAKYAPRYEPELEVKMLECLKETEKLDGRTCLLVDVSGSMDSSISEKSELTRLEAASALAIMLREMGDTDVFTFSERLIEVPARRGFALRDSIHKSQQHSGTYLRAALRAVPNQEQYNRVIVVTDEQSADGSDEMRDIKKRYMVNVAGYQNGVAHRSWTTISGWSESIARYISEMENG